MNNRKNIFKKGIDTTIEILKWGVVIWLLYPIKDASQSPVNFVRVTIGIALFVIFTGKIFYDVVIQSLVRKKRDTLKKDMVALIGIICITSLVAGFMIFFIGLYIVETAKMINQN